MMLFFLATMFDSIPQWVIPLAIMIIVFLAFFFRFFFEIVLPMR